MNKDQKGPFYWAGLSVIKLKQKNKSDLYYNITFGEWGFNIQDCTHFCDVEFAGAIAEILIADRPELDITVEDLIVEYRHRI